MEVIEISGYTVEEKVEIAKRHLLPKVLEGNGLSKEDLKIGKRAIRKIITGYTRESGLRNLERALSSIARKVVVRFAEGDRSAAKVRAENIRDYLGPEKFLDEVRERTKRSGVATGLAWTPVGGAILFIEATRVPGKGRLLLTGSLGEVMKESAKLAVSYLESRYDEEGIDPSLFENGDIHIHVPSGAIPKDGPSAGVTIYSALYSLFKGIPVKHDLAMTGEITLRGSILPVGGIFEKVLAAKLEGIKKVVLPFGNRNDVEEIPEKSRRGVKFIFVKDMEELIEHVMEKSGRGRRK